MSEGSTQGADALQAGRVLLTGAAGMLGGQLLRAAPAGFEVVGTDLATPERTGPCAAFVGGVDLTQLDAVRALFAEHGPFVGVLHPAAYTAVDKAESDAELARKVNADAAENVAKAAAEAQCPMVAVSTDFVFDGRKTTPYVETDPVSPLGVYGRTKLEGEERARAAWPEGVRVVRTQWLYGPLRGGPGGHFPATMLRLAKERDQLRVVADQLGSPTSTLELAPALWDVLRLGAAGVYHASCEGVCSWHELAQATLAIAGHSGVRVDPCTTADYPTPAERPAYSVLDCSKLTALRGRSLAPWRQALEDYLEMELAQEAGRADAP